MKNGYLNGRSNLDTHCAHCNLAVTPEGYDGCIGELDKDVVRNACCGHGNINRAYVQFDHPAYKSDPNKFRIAGEAAMTYIKTFSREQTT